MLLEALKNLDKITDSHINASMCLKKYMKENNIQKSSVDDVVSHYIKHINHFMIWSYIVFLHEDRYLFVNIISNSSHCVQIPVEIIEKDHFVTFDESILVIQ